MCNERMVTTETSQGVVNVEGGGRVGDGSLSGGLKRRTNRKTSMCWKLKRALLNYTDMQSRTSSLPQHVMKYKYLNSFR